MLPKAKLTKLLIAELAAVPTGAQEAQGTAILKRKDARPTEIRKQSAMTTATAGHQHLLYCVDETQSGSTSYESSYVEGQQSDYYTGHCHPWIRNADGTITIGESLGHTHDIGALSASLAKSSTDRTTPTEKAAGYAPGDRITVPTEKAHMPEASGPGTVVLVDGNALGIVFDKTPDVVHRWYTLDEVEDAESGGVMKSLIVKPTNKSTRSPVVSQPALTSTEKSTMDPKDQEIATLKKTLAAVIALSGAEHAHYKTLSGDDQAAFLAKSAADRGTIVADIAKRNEEADKVVYLSKSTGDVYKAKDDPRLVEMAKRMDDQAVAIEKADIRKKATEVLGGMPGDDDTHDLIVRSLRKSGAAAEAIDKAFATLNGMRETSRIGKKAPGFNGGTETTGGTETDALAKLEKGLVAFCKAQNITKNLWSDGLASFVQTDEGAALKKAHDEALAG